MTTDLETIGMLRDSLERYAADNYAFNDRLGMLKESTGFNVKVWSDLAEFGFLTLRLPEDMGGLDGDATSVGALMEVVGKYLMQEPFLVSGILSTTLVARLGDAGQRERLLQGLGSGQMLFSCSLEHADDCLVEKNNRLSGRLDLMMHGDAAHGFLVTVRNGSGELKLGLVNASASGVHRSPCRLLDGRGAARVVLDNAEVELLNSPANGLSIEEHIELLLDEANVALCAEACGMIDALVNTTNDYLKVRTQFGRPLATNQALQHRMANLYLLRQEAFALTRAAERAISQPAAERSRIVSGARAYISQAARQVANEAVQMHGGLGITEELNVSHYYRRIMLLNNLLGGRDHHFSRFVESSLGAA
ncbi:acyl-CoA dehydrogenase family protein [Pseudomonas sp. OIL-1]|uniref:acyl-CoA dehydrogenase family protein n=1 Tax=Pseudomonas sp. OIL-1 TaxID=2706126 RepID=UPI0013A729F3|nr:acyl-CoA dehydrogenase [Pseudomonas sp. OIL-1]QIB51212.1 acyl-CoA dehydrogenase [Pseudomonas sp. OIL-1]